jgi:hypothetical protein
VSDDNIYFKIYSKDSDLIKKERLFYDETQVNNMLLNLTFNDSIAFSIATPDKGLFRVWEHLGEPASLTSTGKLTIESLEAGDTWDDSVNNYADTSDRGHLFTIEGDSYEFDNYSEYHRDLGVDFTAERNRFNTFFDESPADDVVPLIQETLNFIFTLLVGSQDLPADNVDKAGFYVQRNGYISRNPEVNVQGNKERAYYTRHLDVSQDIKDDPYRVRQEINWPQWRMENTPYEDWSSWAMAIDYFQPSIAWPLFEAAGGAVFGGAMEGGQFFEFDAPDPVGGGIFAGVGFPYGPFFEYTSPIPFGAAIISGTANIAPFYSLIAPEPQGSGTFAGAADTDFTQTTEYTMTGGIELQPVGDIVGDEFSYVPEMTGGAVFAGEAITLFGNVYIASGGIIVSEQDITADELGYVYNGTGFMDATGTSETVFEIAFEPTGGMTLTGDAIPARDIEEQMAGGATFAGAAETTTQNEYEMTGGIDVAGTPEYEPEYSYEGIGDIETAGTADTAPEYSYESTGSIGSFGSSGYQEAGL